MEVGAQQPHGKKKVRRKQDDEQTPGQGDAARRILGGRHDNAQRRAAVGDQIHDRNGIELHGQHFHGDLAEIFRLFVHFLLFELVRLIDFQRGQPLQVFQKCVAHGRILAPVFGQKLLRPALHRHDSHRNQRHADQQHRGAGQIDKAENGKQRQRREHGAEKLRQIGPEVGLQLIDAFYGDLHDLRGAGLLLIGGAEPQHLLVDQAPQGFLDGLGGKIAHPAGHSSAKIPHGHRRCRRQQRQPNVFFAGRIFEQRRQQPRNAVHHDDVGCQRKPLKCHVSGNVFFAFANGSDQSFVDHHGCFLRFLRDCFIVSNG